MDIKEIKDSVIFVADDNIKDLKVLVQFLSVYELKVVPLRSGEELLNLIRERIPDMILLDIMMPGGIDGYETCRRLKADEAAKDIPVIFMSALTDTFDKVKGFNLGAVDYITKPFATEEVLSRINAHLTINWLQLQLTLANEELEEKVKIRTRELKKSQQNLIAKNEELFKAKEQLIKSNAYLECTLSSSPDGIVLFDNEGKFNYVNPAFLQLLNRHESDFLGKKYKEITPPIFSSGTSKVIAKIIENRLTTGEAVTCVEEEIIENSGNKIPISYSASGIKDQYRNILGEVAIIRDITERKQIENRLLESEKKYRSVVESSIDGYLFIDENFNIVDCNESFKKIVGYSFNELKNLNYEGLIYDKDKDLDSFIMGFVEKNSQNIGFYQFELANKEGDAIPVEAAFHKLSFEQKTNRWIVIRDIRERKQLEDEVFKTMVGSEEKERERYAKEIHDGLGPVLSTSMIYLHTALEEENLDLLKKYIHKTYSLLEDGVRSIREVSNNLSPNVLKKFGLIEAILSFIEKLDLITKIDFVINSNLKGRISEIEEFTIYRTIIELINNSVKYAEAKKIMINVDFKVNILYITYSDDGQGFEYEKVKKLGTGFGLLNLESRMKKLGGQYHYFSTPGKGTRVNIKIKTKCK